MKVDLIMEKFDHFCRPRKNTTMLRHKFFIYQQSEGQRFLAFVTELRQLSEECEFGELKDSLIHDLIICGVNNSRLRERMLREPELDLQRAIKLGQAAEETKQHIKELSEGIESLSSVHYVTKNTKPIKPQASIKSQPGSNKSTMFNSCKFCGRSHKRGECPAYGRKCHKWKKPNHFANFCQNKYVHHVTHDYSSSSEGENSEFFIGTINASGIAKPVICDKSRKREVLSVQQDVNSPDWSVDLCINKRSYSSKLTRVRSVIFYQKVYFCISV